MGAKLFFICLMFYIVFYRVLRVAQQPPKNKDSTINFIAFIILLSFIGTLVGATIWIWSSL